MKITRTHPDLPYQIYQCIRNNEINFPKLGTITFLYLFVLVMEYHNLKLTIPQSIWMTCPETVLAFSLIKKWAIAATSDGSR